MKMKKGRAAISLLKKPWLLGAVIIALISALFYTNLQINSDEAAEQALLSGQRVEVSLATGEVFGGLDNPPHSESADEKVRELDETESVVSVDTEVVQAHQEAGDSKQEHLTSEDGTKDDSHDVKESDLAIVQETEQPLVSDEDSKSYIADDNQEQYSESISPEPTIQVSEAVAENKNASEGEAVIESAELSPEEKEFSKKMLDERRKKINLSGGKKSIVIVISGLGLSVRSTEAALEVPVNFTLGFSPYAPDVAVWNKKAIVLGFDTLLHLPMETPDYSVDDPGPYALVSTAAAEENLSRLEMLLSLGVGYKGVYTSPQENFSTDINNMRPIITGLADLNVPLLYGKGAGNVSLLQFAEHSRVSLITSDITIDSTITYEAITQQLEKLESIALQNDYAVGIASPYPLTVNTLKYWQKGLAEKNMQVVPISLLLDQLSQERP